MQQAASNSNSGSTRRTRAIIGLVAMIIGALTTTVGFSSGTSLAYEGPVQMPSTSESNNPAYWGEGCWKLDESGGKTWTANADYGIVVLKAAQVDWVYYNVEEGDVLTVGQQAISHFIFCPPAPTTTTTTTTTTTQPTTTTTTSTTQPPTTTTTTTTQPPTTTTTTTTTTSTTTTTTTQPTTTTTTTQPPTTTTTLPCEWDPQLPPGSPDCVPDVSVEAICFDLSVEGEIERYWHRVTNNETESVTVQWAGGEATLAAGESLVFSTDAATVTITFDGKTAATTPSASDEFCQNTVEVTKVIDGPETGPATYTIQISRLVGDSYVQEGDTYQLTGGQTISVPLPSTFNPEGVNYKIEEVDPGDAHANSVTPDSFVLNGHKNETISVTIENTFAAISLEKTVSATSVLPNGELNYGLIAENTGALTLDPVTIYDRLPADVTYVDYSIVGDAGTCAVTEQTKPQLVKCDLDGSFATGEFTPEITLLVRVDADVTPDDTIVNQAMAIGNYDGALAAESQADIAGVFGEGRFFLEAASTDLSCDPAPGEVCDLSAKIGTTVDEVDSGGPTTTTTIVGSNSATSTTLAPQLPKTGSDSTRTMVLLGMGLMMFGLTLLLGSRRPQNI